MPVEAALLLGRRKYSADSRRVLLGTVPVLMQTAAGVLGAFDYRHALAESRRPGAPAFSPAGPQPITRRSKSSWDGTESSKHEQSPFADWLSRFVEHIKVRRMGTLKILSGLCRIGVHQ